MKSLLKRSIAAAGYEIHKLDPSRRTWVPPGHFYSPIVDLDELQCDRSRVFDRNRDIADIDLNEREQLELIAEFKQYYQDLPFSENASELNLYYYDNPYYSYGDGIILSCMLRYFRPKQIIEFGCGFSSCVIIDINRLFLGGALNCTFVDPHPERLESLSVRHQAPLNIVKSRAQDIAPTEFSSLTPNDIVFIDSTHVAKAGSDVNFYLFDLLPSLPVGVLIHFHDIFYPFEYPESWFFEENRSWNENYLLRAFLSGNSNYQIVFFSDFISLKHFETITNAMPLFAKNSGGALWLRKLG